VRIVLCLTILTVVAPASAQTPVHPAADVSGRVFSPVVLPKNVLRHIIRDSGKIFAGAVLKVERLGPGPTGGIGTTQISFRVEEAIRGVRRGQVIQITEWGGLWQTGERYQVGEHALLFLYPASKLGLTSPVGGTVGRLRIGRDRRVGLRTGSAAGVRTVELKTFATAIRRAAKE
jgi:hypothetical protein